MNKMIIGAVLAILSASIFTSYYYHGKYYDIKTTLKAAQIASENLELRYKNELADITARYKADLEKQELRDKASSERIAHLVSDLHAIRLQPTADGSNGSNGSKTCHNVPENVTVSNTDRAARNGIFFEQVKANLIELAEKAERINAAYASCKSSQ